MSIGSGISFFFYKENKNTAKSDPCGPPLVILRECITKKNYLFSVCEIRCNKLKKLTI